MITQSFFSILRLSRWFSAICSSSLKQADDDLLLSRYFWVLELQQRYTTQVLTRAIRYFEDLLYVSRSH